jgi:hypothetical protein
LVVVAGEPLHFEVETHDNPLNIDHVWITIRAGLFGQLRISISTWSRKLAADGFDPRMRVALLPSAWSELPPTGIFPAARLDYADLERAQPITYRETARPDLEEMLRVRTERAIWIEAWGAIYLRDQLGIHQVHSRRASHSVRTNHTGRDGALRFYYADTTAEMVLFKYSGQL